MKKFVAIYYAPAEAMAQSANATPEDREKGMQAWYQWKDKCGSKMIDFGAPLTGGKQVDASGSWKGSKNEIAGYSILQGENLEDVQSLFKDHPHLSWAPGCAIEVHECVAM